MTTTLLPIVLITAGCNRGFEYPAEDGSGGEYSSRDSDADVDADADADSDADADADSDTDADSDADEPGPPANYELLVTPSDIDFGTVSVDSTSTQLVRIENVGLEAVHLNGIGVSNSVVFEIDPDFAVPITLSPGMERSMTVDFTPVSDESFVGEVTFITEENLEYDVDITVEGDGDAAPCEICAPIIDVSPTSVNLVALFCEASESVTVSNNGDRPLNVSAVTVTNDPLATCGTFSRSWGGPRNLAPGESIPIEVKYTVSSDTDFCTDEFGVGDDWNNLHVISNDPSNPDFTVQLKGNGSCIF